LKPDDSRAADAALAVPSDQDATGRSLGDEEIALLSEVVRSGTLTSTRGVMVRRFEERFAAMLGVERATACASGTTAIHAAIAAIDPAPGDEVVTNPITDMGAITPILYQTAVPVFADVDPVSGNLTASTIEAVLSERTRAIVVTHLFGNPAELGPILELAERRGVPVIEDCAQAFGARLHGRPVGTFGAIACFSLQQGKHITTGEGGIVTSNDPALARRMQLFINKGWGYGDPKPDHYFVALNGRMSELQGAVALAQLDKLESSVAQRRASAARLSARLRDLEGLTCPRPPVDGVHSFWKYPLLVDARIGGPCWLAGQLGSAGIASAPRYIQKPAFACAVIRERKTFGGSGFPFSLASSRALDYAPERYPGTFALLARILVLPWNERMLDVHVDYIAARIRTAYAALTAEAADD
jgi:perosamine synthetase